jgi:hypothetical protein
MIGDDELIERMARASIEKGLTQIPSFLSVGYESWESMPPRLQEFAREQMRAALAVVRDHECGGPVAHSGGSALHTS